MCPLWLVPTELLKCLVPGNSQPQQRRLFPYLVHRLARCWPKPLRQVDVALTASLGGRGSHSIPMRWVLLLSLCPSEEMNGQRGCPTCQGDAVSTSVPTWRSGSAPWPSPASGILCPKAGLCSCKLELPTVCPSRGLPLGVLLDCDPPVHGLPSDFPQTQSLLQFVASFPFPSQLCIRIQKVL